MLTHLLPALLLLCSAAPLCAVELAGCPAGAPVGRLRLFVRTSAQGPVQALSAAKRVAAGSQLIYEPSGDEPRDRKAQIAAVLMPQDRTSLIVLEPKPAAKRATWTVPVRIGVVGLVWGPQGLDQGKVQKFVGQDRDLLAQLANYAEQTSQAETLIQALLTQQRTTDSGESLEAAVRGFAAQYSSTGRLDRTASADQQTMVMLRNLNPALSAYDPVAREPQLRWQQSAGLAATVAGMFFGNTVGLAAGGASLLVNLRTMVSPRTEFRSALARSAGSEVALCGRREQASSHVKLAYLWATRLKDADPPALASLPLRLNLDSGEQKMLLKGTGLDRITEITASGWQWRLGPPGDGTQREAFATLSGTPEKGSKLDLELTVEGLTQPVRLTNALLVAGPRPVVADLRQSNPADLDVSLQRGEVRAGSFLQVSLRASPLEGAPVLSVACAERPLARQTLTLRPEEERPEGRLRFVGPDQFFLALQPEVVGQPGCHLQLTVETAEQGPALPVPLGRVVRLPRIEKFQLTEERAGKNGYVGVLEGQDLELIEKTGWQGGEGVAVGQLPAPVPGPAAKQRLRVIVPWPAPSPHAPLWIWLRGEGDSRETTARF